MFFHNHDADKQKDLDASRLKREWFWNLWKQRLQPFNELADEQRVALLVSSRHGSSIRFVVRPDRVLAVPYKTKRQAIDMIASHTGLSRANVSGNPYTADRSEGPGFLLLWRAASVRQLDLPRPADLRLGRHGWGREDDPVKLARWGVVPGAPLKPKSPAIAKKGGQGRQADAALRIQIEMRAMQVARQWLAAHGYSQIEDVSGTKSWDFEARHKLTGKVRRVEVKGVTGSGLSIIATANEIHEAKSGRTMLLVVNGIRSTRSSDGTVVAAGGRLHVLDPWVPRDAELKAEQYKWTGRSTNRPRPA